MAQVSYGTITITDTTDLTTYIRYATEAPLTAASQFQETPTTNTRYIAVLSIPTSDSIPAWNSSSWKWSEFIGTDGLSVKDTRVLYYLKTNSANVPQVDYNTSIVSTDVQNAWTSKNPTYVANGTYWTCLEVVLSDNTTKSWSAPAEDLGLTQTAKDTAEAKSIAQQTIEDSQGALAQAAAAQQLVTQVDTLLGGHFMWHGTALSTLTSAGARVVEQIKNGTTDVSSTPSQWHHNVNIGSNGIQLRYNEAIMAQLAATNQNSDNIALKFYQPPTISGSTTTQGNLTMELSGNALKFYNTSGTITSTFGDSISLASNGAAITIGSTSTNKYNTYIDTQGLYLRTGTTSYATLDSNGLILSKGGVRAGSPNQSGFIYLSTEPYGSYSVNGSSGISDWKEIIGTKFGVTADGTLYASNANISGIITVTSGSNLSAGLTEYSTTAEVGQAIIDTAYTKDEIDEITNLTSDTIENLQTSQDELAGSIDTQDEEIDSLRTDLISTNDTVSSVEELINSYLGEDGYIFIGTDGTNPTIEIGKGDFKNIISQNKMSFYQGSTEVAYISGEKLMINNASVNDEMRMGNFVWTVKEQGKLILKYSPEVTS